MCATNRAVVILNVTVSCAGCINCFYVNFGMSKRSNLFSLGFAANGARTSLFAGELAVGSSGLFPFAPCVFAGSGNDYVKSVGGHAFGSPICAANRAVVVCEVTVSYAGCLNSFYIYYSVIKRSNLFSLDLSANGARTSLFAGEQAVGSDGLFPFAPCVLAGSGNDYVKSVGGSAIGSPMCATNRAVVILNVTVSCAGCINCFYVNFGMSKRSNLFSLGFAANGARTSLFAGELAVGSSGLFPFAPCVFAGSGNDYVKSVGGSAIGSPMCAANRAVVVFDVTVSYAGCINCFYVNFGMSKRSKLLRFGCAAIGAFTGLFAGELAVGSNGLFPFAPCMFAGSGDSLSFAFTAEAAGAGLNAVSYAGCGNGFVPCGPFVSAFAAAKSGDLTIYITTAVPAEVVFLTGFGFGGRLDFCPGLTPEVVFCGSSNSFLILLGANITSSDLGVILTVSNVCAFIPCAPSMLAGTFNLFGYVVGANGADTGLLAVAAGGSLGYGPGLNSVETGSGNSFSFRLVANLTGLVT